MDEIPLMGGASFFLSFRLCCFYTLGYLKSYKSDEQTDVLFIFSLKILSHAEEDTLLQ